jgi:hypothetical protein
MAEEVFGDNLYIPPELGNFDEYAIPEGDAIEKAQSATHLLRVKRSSLEELKLQYEAKIREYRFALDEINALLRD